ncbi:MAG: M23 family metallopeptidase [Patescibacteria group bacterium]|nr:M23 family metallopeptidase [Patescibacteria group bacterium]
MTVDLQEPLCQKEMQRPYHRENNDGSPRVRTILAAALFVVAASGFALSRSATAHASILSFLSSLVGDQQASADTGASDVSGTDSQSSIVALKSVANPDPSAADELLAVAPIDKNALSPEIAAAATANVEPPNTRISIYTVQADDTLSGIAAMFDISVDTIKQANGMSRDSIHPGQQLVILPVDGAFYTVRSGDTVGSIARRYKVSESDIFTYNDIDPSSPVIVAGDQLIIPHGSISVSESRSYITSHQKVPSFEPLLDPVWNWPVAPRGYYSCPLPGSTLTQGLHGHDAVDLAAPYGTPILAAAGGTVTVSKSNGYYGANSNGGYGNFVMLSHSNGSQTLYAHMEKTAVKAGQHVEQGQVIGYIGMTGMTTGPHVHFEIRGAQNPFGDPALCR